MKKPAVKAPASGEDMCRAETRAYSASRELQPVPVTSSQGLQDPSHAINNPGHPDHRAAIDHLLHVNATEMGASLLLAVPKLGDLGTLNDDQLDATADGVDDTLDAVRAAIGRLQRRPEDISEEEQARAWVDDDTIADNPGVLQVLAGLGRTRRTGERL
jgi:hypothetical protein